MNYYQRHFMIAHAIFISAIFASQDYRAEPHSPLRNQIVSIPDAWESPGADVYGSTQQLSEMALRQRQVSMLDQKIARCKQLHQESKADKSRFIEEFANGFAQLSQIYKKYKAEEAERLSRHSEHHRLYVNKLPTNFSAKQLHSLFPDTTLDKVSHSVKGRFFLAFSNILVAEA